MIQERYINRLIKNVAEGIHAAGQSPSWPSAEGRESYVIDMPHREEGLDIALHWLPMMLGQLEPCRMSPGKHSHRYFEMMYVERGVFHNAVEGEDMVLTNRAIAIIGPDIVHNPYVERNSDIVVNLMISPRMMDSAFRFIHTEHSAFTDFLNNYIYGLPNGARHLMIARNDTIDALVEQMVKVYLDRPPMFPERLRLTLAQLLLELCLSYSASGGQGDPRKSAQLADIVGYMRANYATVTLTQLSEAFHYSTAHLSRMISRGMNRSFRELCMDYKLEGAKKLLTYTDLSVAEIAGRLNIADPGYLSRLIRQDSGLSPMAYRRKHSQL